MKVSSTLLATAIGLALAGSAHAVHLDPSGRGQVLIYPYYTVNNHQQTLLSVTNTTSAAQAVKVRFREGYNGREVLEFNLWLPAYDVWTATVFALEDAGMAGDGAALLARDRSCTSPLFTESNTMLADGTSYLGFVNYAYASANEDGGPVAMSRTREGWIEIIAMTDVAEPLLSAITHTSSGVPANCSAVRPNSIIGTPAVSNRPSGGLIGTASIINVGQGTLIATRAEALGGFTNVALFTGTAISAWPNLASANDTVLGGSATARRFDNDGRAVTLNYGGPGVVTSRPVDAVSAVLMADQVYNEYVVDPQLDAGSDWVMTFPTKPFYTDPLFAGAVARAPFEELSSDSMDGKSNVAFFRAPFDREAREVPPIECGFLCPPGAMAASLPYAVSVLPMTSASISRSPVLDSSLLAYLGIGTLPAFPYTSGWARVELDRNQDHSLPPALNGNVLHGLPVIGFWATNLVNAQVSNGVLSNYSAAVRHATSVKCDRIVNQVPGVLPCH